jgi:hypothetical protein
VVYTATHCFTQMRVLCTAGAVHHVPSIPAVILLRTMRRPESQRQWNCIDHERKFGFRLRCFHLFGDTICRSSPNSQLRSEPSYRNYYLDVFAQLPGALDNNCYQVAALARQVPGKKHSGERAECIARGNVELKFNDLMLKTCQRDFNM